MTDQRYDIAELQLSPLAQWVALHGPKSPVLDASTPAGVACRTLVEQGCDAVCVTPQTGMAEVLTAQFGTRVDVKMGPVTALPLAPGSIGSVIAVCPALEGAPLATAVDEFARVLDDDGLLVVVPEGSGSSGLAESGEVSEAQGMISRRFDHVALMSVAHQVVTMLGQGSAVPEGTTVSGDHAAVSAVVASRRPLPPLEGAFVALGPPQVAQWIREWHGMLDELRSTGTRVAATAQDTVERDLILEELLTTEQRLAEAFDPELRDSRSSLQAARKDLREATERIAFLEENLVEANARIRDLEDSTSWRVTEPLRRLKGTVGRYPPI